MPHPSQPVSAATLAVVLAALTTKHFLADFVLQTNGMARGKERAHGWLAPLALHCLCHAVLTLAIVLVVEPRLWWLAAVDFAVHMAIDRAKSLVGQRTRWGPTDTRFWWLLGFDQCLHQLTCVGLAVALCVP